MKTDPYNLRIPIAVMGTVMLGGALLFGGAGKTVVQGIMLGGMALGFILAHALDARDRRREHKR